MALPLNIKTYEEYFDEILRFLKENSFLFNYANTHILSNDILQKFPATWSGHLEKLTTEEYKILISNLESTPPWSNGVFEKIKRLTPYSSDHEIFQENAATNEFVEQKLLSGCSVKKQHEINRLSKVIDFECKKDGVTLIVDLGCGLGYLSQLLHDKYGYKVVGVEAERDRLLNAQKRQEKHFENTQNFVKYEELFVTHKSAGEIDFLTRQHFGNEEHFYLVGLHACADLTISAMDIFLQMKRCKGLIIMPCCYHRMKKNPVDVNATENGGHLDSDSNFEQNCVVSDLNLECTISNADSDLNVPFEDLKQEFCNFPLSRDLKLAHRKYAAAAFLRVPFLRLSCQRAQTGWRENYANQDGHRVFHLMSRAVLELYAQRENAKLIRRKRRAVKKIEGILNFESFIEDVINNGYFLETNTNTLNYRLNLTDDKLNLEQSNQNAATEINDSKFENLISQEQCGVTKNYLSTKGEGENCLVDFVSENKEQVSSSGEYQEVHYRKSENIKVERSQTASAGEKKNVALEAETEIFENRIKRQNKMSAHRHSEKNVDFDKDKLMNYWLNLSEGDFRLCELLVVLQDSMQGVCENLVLVDKLAYLHEFIHENSNFSARFVKVTDEKISPRCFALIAKK